MALVPISIGLNSNPARQGKQAGNARLINCFAEEVGEEAKSPWVINACPGLTPFGAAIGDGGIRQFIEAGGFLYPVAGSQVIKLDATANTTFVGVIPTTGDVFMRRNRAVPPQIGIVSDGYFAVVQSDVLTTVTDPDLIPPTSLAWLDGYGVLPIANGRYQLTAIDDFTTIDALDVGTAESNPDAIVMAHELEREVYFFGEKSTEAHQNTGKATFPFQRSQAMEVGCAAAGSVCVVDTPGGKALAFISHDHAVRLMRGYDHRVISTGEIENLIRKLAEDGLMSTLKATSWSWGGRFFYLLTCPQWSRCYDAKTGYWHERKSYPQDNWRISKVIQFAGKLIAGDSATGQLYRMQDELYDEAGDPMVMEVILPTVHAFPLGGVCNALYIDAISGVGTNTTVPANLDPVMLVDWSKDGGETFCAPREVKLHRLGETGRRVQPITRLGRFGQKGLTVRLRISAAVKRVVMSLQADIEQLVLG